MTRKLLGLVLQAAGGVDRVADRGEVGGDAAAHVADHGAPAVDADAEFQRRRQFGVEVGRQAGQRALHFLRGRQCLPRAGLGPGFDPEQGHHAVAGELVGDAATAFDRAADGFEVAVKQEHDVVGQALFRDAGEAAQVGEQDANFAFIPRHSSAGEGLGGVDAGGQQRGHRDVAQGPQLAGQAHVGRGADACEHPRFGRARRRQHRRVAGNPHPAGGTAAAPTADRCVGNSGMPAGFEHRVAVRHADHAFAWIGDAHRAAPFAPLARGARAQGEQQQAGAAAEKAVAGTLERGARGGVGRTGLAKRTADPVRVLGERDDRAAALDEAEQGQHRQQQRAGVQGQARAPVPRLGAQPVVDADAAVGPRHQHQPGLPGGELGSQLPEQQQKERVRILQPVVDMREAGVEHMVDRQPRNAQAERELRRLERLHAKLAAKIDRVQGKGQVGDDRRGQQR